LKSDKRQKDKYQEEQDLKNELQKNEQPAAQTDGFRYDYDDSSDVK
jgi:hypothetical protein